MQSESHGPHFLLAILAIVVSGCASVQPLAEDSRRPSTMPARITERFCYDAGPVDYRIELSREKRAYRVYDVVLKPGPADAAPVLPFARTHPRR